MIKRTLLAVTGVLLLTVGCATQVDDESTATSSDALKSAAAPYDPGGGGGTGGDTLRPPTACEAKCMEGRTGTRWCSEYCLCREVFKYSHYVCERYASSVAIDI